MRGRQAVPLRRNLPLAGDVYMTGGDEGPCFSLRALRTLRLCVKPGPVRGRILWNF
jgi:hypothetical protein